MSLEGGDLWESLEQMWTTMSELLTLSIMYTQ